MVDLFRWLPVHAVGIAELDDEHRELYGLANRLINLSPALPDPTELGELIDEVIRQADRHFRDEEARLALSECPDLEAHRRAHRGFINTMLLFKSQHRARSLRAWEVARYVTEWILTHEERERQRLRRYLSA